jgi:uncharacterized protein YecE (DUF72 family)
MRALRCYVGTAGWSLPRTSNDRCAGGGTHLERYARVFECAEINSSFQRSHTPATYARWAASTPDGFRFSVKLPKEITHLRSLRQSRGPLERFLEESAGLGSKRGPLLVQLPPSFEFDARVIGRFFSLLRSLYAGPVACEPRHASWFDRSEDLLVRYDVARVAADPACVPEAGEPAGWAGLTYYRLHGSPRTYWSAYDAVALDRLASLLRGRNGEVWCVFDNTAGGAAFENAWYLQQHLRGRLVSARPE